MAEPQLIPVDHDPFADTPGASVVPVDYDPFGAPKTEADNWKVDPAILAKPKTYWMSPDEYLSRRDPLGETAKTGPQWQSLVKSMGAKGEALDDAPTLMYSNGKLLEDESDGRHRALWAKEHGVDLIPVRIKGQPPEDWNFKPTQEPYPGLVPRMGEVGIGAALAEAPSKITDWWKTTPSALAQYGESQDVLRAAYDQSEQKKAGMDFITFKHLPENQKAVLEGALPIATGVSPGEGLIRSPIPFTKAPPVSSGLMPAPVLQEQRNQLREFDMQNRAAELVSKKVREDTAGGGVTAQEAIERMNAAREEGRPLSLADLGGKNVERLLGSVYRQGGPAATYVEKTLRERSVGSTQRLDAEIKGKLATDSMYRTQQQLEDSQARMATPLYKEAFTQNRVVASPEIDRVLNTPPGKEALATARRWMQTGRKRMGDPDPALTEQAQDTGVVSPGGVAHGLNLESLDWVKQALDDQVSALYRAGKNKEAGVVREQRDSLRSELDRLDVTGKAGPTALKLEGGAYKRARAAWAGPERSLEALDWGKRVLKMNAEQIRDEFSAMEPSEQEHARIGLADTLREALGTRGITAAQFRDMARDSKNVLIREKIRPLFRSEQEFNKFINAVTDERAIFETHGKITKGSQTQERAQADKTADAAIAAMAGTLHVAGHNPWWAMRSYLSAARDLGLLRKNNLNESVARLLLQPHPAGLPMVEGPALPISKNTLLNAIPRLVKPESRPRFINPYPDNP